MASNKRTTWTPKKLEALEKIMIETKDVYATAEKFGISTKAVAMAWCKHGLHLKHKGIQYNQTYRRKPPHKNEAYGIYWRQLPIDGRYWISTNGDVYSTISGKLIKQHYKKKAKVCTCTVGGVTSSVAKLVYMTWFPEKYINDGKHKIVHKDGNPCNNHTSNLMIMDSNNVSVYIKNRTSRRVVLIGEYENKVFRSVGDIAKYLGVSRYTINQYCRGLVENPKYNFDVMYLDEYNDMMKWRNERK